jgi:hypothetical protein
VPSRNGLGSGGFRANCVGVEAVRYAMWMSLEDFGDSQQVDDGGIPSRRPSA